MWFYNQVNHEKKWDIKRREPWIATIGTDFPGSNNTIVIFKDKLTTPEALGNITYGYLGSAAGFPGLVLLSGGDYAADGILGVIVLRDSLEDKRDIIAGIDWYNNK